MECVRGPVVWKPRRALNTLSEGTEAKVTFSALRVGNLVRQLSS